MPKQKTHRGAAKRFSLTKTGKVKHKKMNANHILNKKTTKLVYHSETGCYTGYQLNADYADGLTGEMLQFRNVFILYADIRTYDSYGRLKVDLVTESTGWYARDGKVIPITWSKEDKLAPTYYYYADGTEVELNQGRTWVAQQEIDNLDRMHFYATEEEFPGID